MTDITQATTEDADAVFKIVQETIGEVYPHYYPAGAVRFFADHHRREKIEADVLAGRVWILRAGGVAAGTVTVAGNEINRLFVLPAFQGRGFGRRLMDFAEEVAFREHESIRLDASLPAQEMYLKRGYRVTELHKDACGNGDYLCYCVMQADRPEGQARE